MTVAAVWSAASLLHDPGGEVWVGIPLEGDETPPRGEAMKRALDSLGIPVVEPEEHPDSAITSIHEKGMLDYLRTAYEEWVAAGYPDRHRQDHVVPYAFPHPGAFGHGQRRDPRSRAAMAGVYCMDTCTTIGPGTYRGLRYAVDAALTAADLVLNGAPSAYAAVRPPGHHAGTDYFGGSCYLNNAAITAQHLTDSGVGRVAIIDIDAHHGNGTQQIFYQRDDVLYASVHIDPGEGWFPHWSGFADEVGAGPGEGWNHNLPLHTGDGDEEFVAGVEALASLVAEQRCETLVVSLGVDAGADDVNSPLDVSSRGFSRVGALLAALGLPTILIQEGGYDLLALQRDLAAILSRFSS